MRESGEALVKELGITNGLKVLDLGCGDGTTALPAARLGADVLGVDIASNLVEAGNRARRGRGPGELPVPGRRRVRPARARGRPLRPRRQHLRGDVRAEAVRRGQGDGARDAARRPDRHGELDPERPDARRADPEDQLRVLAAAAGGLRQPDDLGRRGQRDRAIRAARACPRRRSRSRDTYTFNFPGTPAELSAQFRTYYGPTMNAFEAAEQQRPRRRAARPSWKRCSTARTRARARRHHLDSRRRSCASRSRSDPRGDLTMRNGAQSARSPASASMRAIAR